MKMKISCILLSFICVYVLADISIMDYIESVEISNAQLREATDPKVANGEGLDNVLTNMIDVEHYKMKVYNQMFTVPELSETHNFNLLQDAISIEKYTLQPKIFKIIGIAAGKLKNIPVDDDSNQISTIPADTTKGKETLKCPTLSGNAKMCLTESFKKICDPQYKKTYTATSSQTSRLKELGKARRDITGNAIINVLTQKLSDYEADFKSGGRKYPVKKICVLIGIWVSLKMSLNTYPINKDDICEVLFTIPLNSIVKIGSFEGIYYQLEVNAIHIVKKKLTVLLKENLSIPLEFTLE
ncbi:uncharacterized protein LOC126839803 [Adelges cooleyi]|uniref:uncharacterized protein LOC126839803 n=1 Tax=Adelges cooleyi TaxID=133065 RepID=UPI00218007D9|nr:uncharacterized protein LOC126839803 [Adelges cooleyi]